MADRKDMRADTQEEFRRALSGEAASGEAAQPRAEAGRAAEGSSPAQAASGGDGARTAVAERAQLVRRKQKRRRMVAGAVAAVLVAAAAVTGAMWAFAPPAEEPESFFDESAQAGQAPNKTPAELQAELNRVVEEGMFNISIASVIEFPSPDGEADAYIENIPGNPYDMAVAITLDDTGETVYQSKGIAPGNYIEKVTLSKALEPGAHDATATFTAYDRETHQERGKAAAEVALIVGKGGDASG